MENTNNAGIENGAHKPGRTVAENGKNPFENNTPVEKDIAQSQEALDKEQQFKEAQTERD